MQHSKNKTHLHTEAVTPEASTWQLRDIPIDHPRPIRIIVIGAGYSGVFCGIRIPEKIRNCELVIYEKNSGVGGTWFENRYPGAACDIPAHAYQYSFNPKHDWSKLYAPSWEIRQYIEDTSRKYSADRFIKLEHEVTRCSWDQKSGKWNVHIKTASSEFDDECDILISARGNLNNKQWPSIPGLNEFRGEVMHSAAWKENYDFKNKRVGVIGSGSSAIQIVPNLRKEDGVQLSAFIRSRTWIAPPLGASVHDRLGMDDQFRFSPSQIEAFKHDHEAWLQFRLHIEAQLNRVHAATRKGSEMQTKDKKAFEESMRVRLEKRPEYFDWLIPSFSPGCRRLTPGPGFLEALLEDNVDFVRDPIVRIEQSGIVTSTDSGEQLHELDVIVCATGFYTSAAPPFKVEGIGGRTIQSHWKERSYNYMSMATDDFPNHFFMCGPNGLVGEGSLLLMIESVGNYIVKAIRKLQKENIKSMVIKKERVRDFTRFCDTYFPRTVFSEDCACWYRKDGQGKIGKHVTGLWPGSSLHAIEAFRSPRWEDYEYEYHEEANGAEANVMGWLGNGWTVNQLRPATDEELGFYANPRFQDAPVWPLPEEKEEYRLRPWSY